MMTTAATTTTNTGDAAEMPDGVGEEFESPLKRDEAEFSPSGVVASPPQDRDRPGVGRVRRRGWTIIANPTGGKLKRA